MIRLQLDLWINEVIPKRNIEGHWINSIFVALKCVNQIPTFGVPNFAGPVITARDKFVTVFVERAVGEGQNMCFEGFKQLEILLFFLLNFHYEFYNSARFTFDERLELSLFTLGYYGLLMSDLLHQFIDIRPE